VSIRPCTDFFTVNVDSCSPLLPGSFNRVAKDNVFYVRPDDSGGTHRARFMRGDEDTACQVFSSDSVRNENVAITFIKSIRKENSERQAFSGYLGVEFL
jgi:hypothetical protein